MLTQSFNITYFYFDFNDLNTALHNYKYCQIYILVLYDHLIAFIKNILQSALIKDVKKSTCTSTAIDPVFSNASGSGMY